jgi:hypothetical protein
MAKAGLEVNREGAKRSADAAEHAGDQSFMGGLLQGGLGILGGLL